MKRILVIGGYGTFGSHVCRELAARGVPLTVAGRNRTRAETFAQTLGGGVRGVAVDVMDSKECRSALKDHGVAISCAGPFHSLDATLIESCLAEGCQYADIGDDRRYATMVQGYHERFWTNSLTAVYGCSSLPGISGALALLACEATTTAIERVRVTLFIGNNNPKGRAAVRSLLAGLGRPIAAPQGTVRGLRDREVVSLPEPFGRRGVFNFDSPDYDLLPSLMKTVNVSVKLGFELRLATYSFALLAWLGWRYGATTARLLSIPAWLFARFGCSGGAVMTELFLADGSIRRVTISARNDGQRMAALPGALAAQRLSAGTFDTHGVMTAYEFLGAGYLINELVAAGFDLDRMD